MMTTLLPNSVRANAISRQRVDLPTPPLQFQNTIFLVLLDMVPGALQRGEMGQ